MIVLVFVQDRNNISISRQLDRNLRYSFPLHRYFENTNFVVVSCPCTRHFIV